MSKCHNAHFANLVPFLLRGGGGKGSISVLSLALFDEFRILVDS